MRRIPAYVWLGVFDVAILWLGVTLALMVFVTPNPFVLERSYSYSQDGLAHGLLVKTVMEVGWYPATTPWIGAPFGVSLFDYPFSDAINLALIKILALFTDEWIVVVNLFYLLGFYLSSLTAYCVFRSLALTRVWAVVGALLFAFLPYHLLRREHLLLTSYFTMPLGVLLAWYAWKGLPATARPGNVIPRAVLVAAVGSGGVYYAFFSFVVVSIATLARMLRTRSLRSGIAGAVMATGIVFTVLLNVTPSLVHWAREGANPDAALRAPPESDIYGLRLTQMVLPVTGHRSDALRDLVFRYESTFPNATNETKTAALGFAASLGLMILGVMIFRRLAGIASDSGRGSFLTLTAAGAFVLGTVGGFGSLFALLVSPMIRGYNRISVVIGFIALAALFVVLQRLLERAHVSRGVTAALAATIAVVGIYDQTPRLSARIAYGFSDDTAFVKSAEAQLPAGTMVWQMPYQPFPEGAWVHNMPHYGPLRGYLHSSQLRWSYGAVRGRDGDVWLRSLSARPVEEQIDFAARSGFGAVYIDRRGYADAGKAVMSVLKDKIGPPIAESRDGTLAMYRMTPRGTEALALRDVRLPIDTPIRLDGVDLGPLVKETSGLSDFEPWGRWTEGRTARIELVQPLPLRFTLRIEIVTAMPQTVKSGLIGRVGGVDRWFKLEPGVTVDLPFVLSTSTRTIEIVVPNPVSPKSLGMGEDERMLGVGIKSITVIPRPPAEL